MTDRQAKRLWMTSVVTAMVAEGGPHPVEICGCLICCRYRVQLASVNREEARKQFLRDTVLKFCDYVMILGVSGGLILSAKDVVLVGMIAAGIGGLLRFVFIVCLLRRPK